MTLAVPHSRSSRSLASMPGTGSVRPAACGARRLADDQEPHAPVADIQRARILSATFDVAYERGAANVTVGQVVQRSGVSRRTFYETFSDSEQCLLAALDEAIGQASARVLPAYRGETRWEVRIRAGLTALLCFLDEEPVIGRLLIAESLGDGSMVAGRRTEALAGVIAAIDEGRRRGAAAPPPLTAEGIVGGMLSVLRTRLVDPAHEPLVRLTGQLMSMIVLPYLGPAAARRELERPVEVQAGRGSEPMLLADPFKEAGLRLTYRTVRVLMAIAAHAGASNRTIGDLAEIRDQGQISKLLARLERLGLIENASCGGHEKGMPNRWSLTPTGCHVTRSIGRGVEDKRAAA